jgi:hypothetical protein
MKDEPRERPLGRDSASLQAAADLHRPSLISYPLSVILHPASVLFLVIWLGLLVAGRSDMFRDPGTFWHVAAGEKMLATGRVIVDDSFSFTRGGQPWVADQWLAECGMAIVHRLAGWDGLLLATATLLAGIYAWIAARLLRAGLHWLPTVLLIAVAMMAGSPQFHVRPLVGTIVLLGVTFAWLVDVESGRRRFRQLCWLVPLFILWTNVHGGVLAGLGTAGLCISGWCVVAVWILRQSSGTDRTSGARASRPAAHERAGRPRSEIVEMTTLLVALAATILLNPYDMALPWEWLRTLAMPLPSFIVEHAPLDLSDPTAWGTLALAAGYLVALVGIFPQRPRITWLVPLVWFLLALSRVRNAPLFAITAVIALGDVLPHSRVGRWLQRRGLLANLPKGVPPLATSSAEGNLPRRHSLFPAAAHAKPLILPAIVVAAAVLLQVGGVRLPVVGHGWARFDPAQWPIDLLPKLHEIEQSNPDGTPIFNDMNFGGFLIYHAPRLRVFVDDRCSLYGTDFLLAYDRARREDPAEIDRWRQEYDFRYAVVQTGRPFDRYLSGSAEWTLLGRSQPATLYQHK